MQEVAVKQKEFVGGAWETTIDVQDFILRNYTPYDGDESFLAPASAETKQLWEKVKELFRKERENGGVLALDTDTIPSIISHAPAYLDKKLEKIVGFQTDAPLKRAVKPYGGLRLAEEAAVQWGYELNPKIKEVFTKYRKSHNKAVFQVYTPLMRKLKSANILIGVPDNFGRGRIIGDYRRVALYGVDRLIEDKRDYLEQMSPNMTEENIRLREEIVDQIQALEDLKTMAAMYGYDISLPAQTAQEAIQWTYFGYLAMVKGEDSAACSLPQLDLFFDIFIERDIANGLIDEEEAQALIDNFVIKVRMIRHLRIKVLAELMAGDAIWATTPLGGKAEDGRHKVNRTSYRMLQTLRNLGPAPEPNLTVLIFDGMPETFKHFAADISAETCSIQFENDDLMRPFFGDDYAISCCVSAQRCGKQMQFFGARCNMPKLLLLAINGGREEINGELIGPEMEPLTGLYLNYDEVRERLSFYMDWFTEVYTNTLNLVHYMHDKYYYESLQMALYDSEVSRTMAFGIAGISIVADSLSAIRYAKVKPKTNEDGLVVDYEIKGDFPKYGNDDDRVDELGVGVVREFIEKLRRFPLYRNAQHTLHLLTITWNILYGKATGNTPDGRKAGEPFAPGANPMHGRDTHGAIASLNSVAKIPYECCLDGISNTFNVVPSALGKSPAERRAAMAALLDGYFSQGAHHLNVNVVSKELLEDAMEYPEKYPQLTIRVSGYAVNFIKLTWEQQREVISRTFHNNVAIH
ncbi:formate C-acetyltransferase [Candidatus Acetothermia bacterium]|nr:formate C-acetyltransferase [Candidatus Acetothermia bacterium]